MQETNRFVACEPVATPLPQDDTTAPAKGERGKPASLAELPRGLGADRAGRAGDSSEALATAAQRRRRLEIALGVALGSRLLVWIAGYLSGSVLAPLAYWPRQASAHPGVSGLPALVWRGWANWDGVWYLGIARFGYERPYSSVFFPLYPLLIHLLSFGGRLPLPLVGVTISLGCFVAACILLFGIVADRFDSRVALWTIVFLSIAPVSFFFQAVYTESLFLLLCVACFWFAEQERWLMAGCMGMLATITRNSGVLLCLPMALLYMEAVGWRLRRVRAGILALVLPPMGLALYAYYLARAKGNALLFLADERHWHRKLAPPWTSVGNGVVAAYRAVKGLVEPTTVIIVHRYHHIHLVSATARASVGIGNILAAVALVVGVALLVATWRRLPLPYLAFAAAALLLPLLEPTRTRPLYSLPRFLLVVFPLAISMTLVTERRPLLRAVVAGVSIAALVWLSARFAQSLWVA